MAEDQLIVIKNACCLSYCSLASFLIPLVLLIIAGEDRETRLERGGKILTNWHAVGAACTASGAPLTGGTDFYKTGNKVVVIQQAHRQTLARQSNTLSHSILKVLMIKKN